MDDEIINYSSIQIDCPKSWEDFNKFYYQEFGEHTFLKGIDLTQLPFEMLLGIFLKYFNENGIELDICNTEYSLLPEQITEAFKTYEKVFSHYS